MNYEDRVTKEYVEGLMSGGTKIVLGSYVGTGTYGSGNRNRITFDFQPKLLLFPTVDTNVYRTYSAEASIVCITWGVTQKFIEYDQTRGINNIYFNGNTVSWYCDYNEYYQRNNQGQTYYYLAIG